MTLCMNYKNAAAQKKIDVSEGIDVNKIRLSRECMLPLLVS